jgi:hypothetical protein
MHQMDRRCCCIHYSTIYKQFALPFVSAIIVFLTFFFVSVSLSKEHPEFSNTTTVIILFCLLPKVIQENMFALGETHCMLRPPYPSPHSIRPTNSRAVCAMIIDDEERARTWCSLARTCGRSSREIKKWIAFASVSSILFKLAPYFMIEHARTTIWWIRR